MPLYFRTNRVNRVSSITTAAERPSQPGEAVATWMVMGRGQRFHRASHGQATAVVLYILVIVAMLISTGKILICLLPVFFPSQGQTISDSLAALLSGMQFTFADKNVLC